jgi:hypothetical protein
MKGRPIVSPCTRVPTRMTFSLLSAAPRRYPCQRQPLRSWSYNHRYPPRHRPSRASRERSRRGWYGRWPQSDGSCSFGDPCHGLKRDGHNASPTASPLGSRPELRPPGFGMLPRSMAAAQTRGEWRKTRRVSAAGFHIPTVSSSWRAFLPMSTVHRRRWLSTKKRLRFRHASIDAGTGSPQGRQQGGDRVP